MTCKARGRKPKAEKYERLTITLPPGLLQMAMETLARKDEGKSELLSRLVSESLVTTRKDKSGVIEDRLLLLESRLAALEAAKRIRKRSHSLH
jgi:hypothetical protein